MMKIFLYLSLLLASFSSCIRETDVSKVSCADTYVQLVIGNTSSRVGTDASPDPIKRLRVYVFNTSNECVGYLFRDNLNVDDVISLPMPLDKNKISSESNVYFYVLANDLDEWELNENTGKQDLDAMDFNSWQNNSVPSVAPMVNNDNGQGKGGYKTSVTLTGEDWQTVNVNIQPIVGRLRLLFNKEGDGDASINNAVVYHRPDNYFLYSPDDDSGITFENNTETLVDEFVDTDKGIGSTTDYECIGQTYLLPNIYGSTDPDNPVYTNDSDGSKAYKLKIEYTVRGEKKTKDVYLPQVSRNHSLDVKGTLKSGELNLTVNVSDWIDVPEFGINYNDNFDADLTKLSDNPIVGDAENGTDAYAVVYGDEADARHDLTLKLKLTNPIGAIWTANVSNGGAFEVLKSDGSMASGIIDGNEDGIEISLRAKSKYEPGIVKETNLYVTLVENIGITLGKQVINNSLDSGALKHPGTTTDIRVRLISLDEWNKLNP